MPMIPAFCNTCGAVFSSGFVVENSMNISFSGNTAGPCPSCGGRGHIPDGVFNFIGNTIEILSGSQRTIDELEKLAKILRSKQKNGSTVEEIRGEVERELPELQSIVDILPKTRQDLYSFITVILGIITLLVSLYQSGNQTKVEINNVVNYIYQNNTVVNQDVQRGKVPKLSKNVPIKSNKVGRNEKCTCGSGKKYKYCHGK